MGVRQIGKSRLIIGRIDVKVKSALNPQTGSDDFAPDAHQNLGREVSLVPGEEPAQNRRFAGRPERRDEGATTGLCCRLFHLGDRARDIGAPDQKVVQGVIDPIDLAAEIFQRAGLLFHQRPTLRSLPI
jgi:hypothetical protein